jgi:hypothetical protein
MVELQIILVNTGRQRQVAYFQNYLGACVQRLALVNIQVNTGGTHTAWGGRGNCRVTLNTDHRIKILTGANNHFNILSFKTYFCRNILFKRNVLNSTELSHWVALKVI